jgi:hypothetical protein
MDAHFDRTWTVQHHCGHDGAVLSEGPRTINCAEMTAGTDRKMGLDQFILLMALLLQVISGLNLMRAVAHRSNDLGLDAARLRRSRSRMIPPMDSTVFVVVGRPRVG